MDLDTQVGGYPGQLGGEPPGVDKRAVLYDMMSSLENRTGDLGLHSRPIEQHSVGQALKPSHLVRLVRDRDDPVALEVHVDAEVGDVRLEHIEVVTTQLHEVLVLVGPALLPVLVTVGQARLDEPPVAAGSRPADRLGLQQRDPGSRVPPLRQHSSPEPAVATTHNRQISMSASRQRRMGRPVQLRQPEHAKGAVTQAPLDRRMGRRLPLEDC